MPSAVDELLRFESPVQMTFRYAMEKAYVGGSRIRPGDSVCLMLAAANRDPERFTNPATLDLARLNNRHLTLVPAFIRVWALRLREWKVKLR